MIQRLSKNCLMIVLFLNHPMKHFSKNLCLETGYAGKQNIVASHNYEKSIRPCGEENKKLQNNPEFHALQWDGESFHSWFKRFRKFCPRYEKTLQFFKDSLSLTTGVIT